jgi:hypothetical protein
MEQELRDALREIRDDIKELIPLKQAVDRHEMLLYGLNGKDGMLTDVDKLKGAHKMYNKFFTGMGAVLTFITGNVLWRWLGGRAY